MLLLSLLGILIAAIIVCNAVDVSYKKGYNKGYAKGNYDASMDFLRAWNDNLLEQLRKRAEDTIEKQVP